MADARLAAHSDEVLTDGSPSRQLSGLTVEALTNQDGTPERRLSGIVVEAITDSDTPVEMRLSGISIEVLVPVKSQFVGWGTPL